MDGSINDVRRDDYSSLPYLNSNPFVNPNGDRFPKKQREVAEAHERILVLEKCLKSLKAEAAAEAAAAAAAAETHPQKKLARYKYPTMDKTQLGDFRLHVVQGEINDSQIIVVLGKKGTGKSTFLQMLATTMKLDEGEISDGKMPNVSYKPQNLFPKNNPSHTVGDLLDHKIHDSSMNPEFVNNVMEPLHINLLRDKLVKDLSPGQAQTVALCLCLGKPADIYLIDVPSAHLEPEQCAAAAKAIKWFIRHEKKAAVVVECNFIIAFRLAHGYIVTEGQPFVNCTATGPVSVLAGANLYLSQLDNRLQRAPVELWLDLKKLEEITERREQEAAESSSSSSSY